MQLRPFLLLLPLVALGACEPASSAPGSFEAREAAILLGVLALHAGDSEWLRWTLPLGPSDDGLSLVQASSVFPDLDGDGLSELVVSEVAP